MGLFTTPEERALVLELLQQMKYATAHLSKTSELLATGVTNHVLEVKTHTFDATGVLTLEFNATCGALKVSNIGITDVTVTSSTPQGAAPPNGGVGVGVVPAGTWDVVNLASRFFTLYGTSGQRVFYQAFTIGGIIGGGLVGVDGGAP